MDRVFARFPALFQHQAIGVFLKTQRLCGNQPWCTLDDDFPAWNSEINAHVVTLPCAMVVVWRLDKYPTAHNLIVEGLQLFCSVTNVGFDGLGRQHVFECNLYWNVNGRHPLLYGEFSAVSLLNRAY